MPVGPRFVGDTELPWDEGTPRGPDVHRPDPAGRPGRWTLTGMAADHRFYTAALLAATGVPFDPVEVYWAEAGLDRREAPYSLVLDRVVFAGLTPPLDRTVFACPAAHAPGLFRFLDRFAAGVGVAAAWESLHQRLAVVDWQLVAALTTVPPSPPTVPVEAYGLVGTADVYHWKLPGDPCTQPIRLVRTPRKATPRRRPFTT